MIITETATVTAALVAVVKVVKEYVPQVSGGLTVLLAAVLGLLAGYFHVQGLDLVSGLMAGLSASGVVTVADRINSK